MPIIFEPPAALLAAQSGGSLGSPSDGSGVASNGGSQVWIGASPANADPTWGGCQVWLSFDDVTYGQIGTIASRANQGVLTAALAPPPGANPDTTDTLAVDLSMSGGALPTGSDADAQAGRTLCYVDGELIAYGLATPTTGDAYDLTDLYRGLYGSPGTSHSSGTEFVLLDDNIFKYNLPSGYAGQPLYFKFASFNAWGGGVQDLSTLTAVTYTPTGGVVPSGVITGGDASVSAAGVIALNAINGNIGTFQGLTVNAKGLVTGAVNESYLAGNQTLTLSGDVSGSGTTAIATTLATTGVTAGSYTCGGFTVDAKGRLTAASSGTAPPSAANPTGTVGLTTANGSATTFMRSDAAPSLSQGISPTWTGNHIFAGSVIWEADNNLIGGVSINAALPSGAALYIDVPAAAGLGLVTERQSAGGAAASQRFYVNRGSAASPAAVQDNDAAMAQQSYGWDGTHYTELGLVRLYVDGTVSSGVVPGRFELGLFNSSGSLTTPLVVDSSGNVKVNATGGTGGTGTIIADQSGTLHSAAFTVSSLPAASTAGRRAFVTDATATTFGSAVIGGGANGVPVYSDGTTWRIG